MRTDDGVNDERSETNDTQGSGDQASEVAADQPVRRTRRRAASRPAGPPAAVAVFSAAESAAEPSGGEVMVPTAAVVAVFQAPELPAVPPRRRSGTKSDVADVADVADDAESQAPAKSKSGSKGKSGDKDGAKGKSGSKGKSGGKGQGKKAGDADEPAATDEAEPELLADADADTEASESEGDGETTVRRRRRRGGRGRGRKTEGVESGAGDGDEDRQSGAHQDAGEQSDAADGDQSEAAEGDEGSAGSRRRRRRRRRGSADAGDQPPADEVVAIKGSTRLEAKRQRRREGRANRGMRAPILTEAEFLARREAVDRAMVMRQHHGVTQIAVLEDDVLVEHYVSSSAGASLIGNIYLGRVQNVLPSMEAAFVDIGRGRNAVLYAGEVNWDAAGLEGQPKRIELALQSGGEVLVQVTKDPVGHKGARLTSQISLPGRFLVYVPQGGMTGISRKLPDRERARLKRILKTIVPEDAGVIVRTAAEGASEEQLRHDVERLAAEWERISAQAKGSSAPAVLRSEPDLAIKVVRDIFNEDFGSLVISGPGLFDDVSSYVSQVAPDLGTRVRKWVENDDVFTAHRIDEQLAKALDRKVWLPSGGSLVIDRTEAMTVIDVNTGKFVGQGGNLEETVTRNNLEAAEEIVRQLRLRDIGGIIVVDFIDMVMESNRELVLRRLVECLSRDRTKHQVAEVTSLGLVQMTRKRIGQGLLETFSTSCDTCGGRGVKVQNEPVEASGSNQSGQRVRRQRITGPIPGAPAKPKSDADASEADVSEVDASEVDVSEVDVSEVVADADAAATADVDVVATESESETAPVESAEAAPEQPTTVDDVD